MRRRLGGPLWAVLPLLPLLPLLPHVAAAQAPARPKLVVFITVDQMRGDYLQKWAPQFTGGRAGPKRGGAGFVDGVQESRTPRDAAARRPHAL